MLSHYFCFLPFLDLIYFDNKDSIFQDVVASQFTGVNCQGVNRKDNLWTWGELANPREERPQFSSVQLLSCVWLFETPWIAARQASLSITNSQSLLKLMSNESVMPSSHLILYHPLLLLPSLPASGTFPVSQLFSSGGQGVGALASASVLPMNIRIYFL